MTAPRRSLSTLLCCLVLATTTDVRSAAESAPKPFNYPFFKSTWSADPSEGFFDLPRTAQELRDSGKWAEISNCREKFDANFPGDRYIETPANDDTDDIVLIFDGAGFIAGIQMAVPQELTFQDRYHNFTGNRFYQKAKLLGTDVFFMTVYFVDPQIICQGGRAEWQFEQQGTIHRIHLQAGPTPDNIVSFPLREEAMKHMPGLFEQNCFPSMGTHYVDTDESVPGYHDGCKNDIGSFTVNYNHGRVASFTFVPFAPISGRRIELLSERGTFITFNNPPQCLRDLAKHPGVRVMHVFFDDYNADCSDRKSIIHQQQQG